MVGATVRCGRLAARWAGPSRRYATALEFRPLFPRSDQSKFDGRNWPAFHHHATMTFLAYGFLALKRQRARDAAAAEGAEPPPGEAAGGA